MIRRERYDVAHDNPILARVRQFHESKKSDPYIIYVENKNTSSQQVTLFDAQNNLGVKGNNLSAGISVNTAYNYTTGANSTTSFNTGTQTFNAGTNANFTEYPSVIYDLGGKTLAQAESEFSTNPDFPISVLIVQTGVTDTLEFKFATSDSTLTNLDVGLQSFGLTQSTTPFFTYGQAGSSYNEFLQQISIRPMHMEGNFIESTNIAVIQTNDFIVEQADVTGQSAKTYMVLNLDPYMRSSQRTMPTFNLIDGTTSLTLTIGANSKQTMFLYALEEMDSAEELDEAVTPETMVEADVSKPTRPFDDYELPTDGFSSF